MVVGGPPPPTSPLAWGKQASMHLTRSQQWAFACTCPSTPIRALCLVATPLPVGPTVASGQPGTPALGSAAHTALQPARLGGFFCARHTSCPVPALPSLGPCRTTQPTQAGAELTEAGAPSEREWRRLQAPASQYGGAAAGGAERAVPSPGSQG